MPLGLFADLNTGIFWDSVNVIIIECCYFFHIHFSSVKEYTQSFKEGACQMVLGSDSS